MQLLERCSATLVSSVPTLLEVIFTLAQDDWPQVFQPARAWIELQHEGVEPAQRPVTGTSND